MLRSLIVDDEPAARSRLSRLLSVYPQVSIIGEARDGMEAIAQIEEHRPDLVFLDIEMPGLSGFQVLRALADGTPMPLVIFVTGYDEHALAAFDANALAYLLKPVEPERLALVIGRAERISRVSPKEAEERRRVQHVVQSAPVVLRQIVARKRDSRMLLTPDDVVFFASEDGIVKAYTSTDCLWVNYQLNELEAGLPAGQFFRAHRTAIVNLNHVAQIQPYFKSSFLLKMADAARSEITVSTRQAKVLRERIPGL